MAPPLNYIHTLKIKRAFIFIERNIGVRSLKPVQIIGWWTDTDSIIYGNGCILKCMSAIQNPGSESIHSHNRNVDYEGISMCHWNVGLIQINTLNMSAIWRRRELIIK